jgi:putative transposase
MGRPPRNHTADLILHVTVHAIPDRLCFPEDSTRALFLQLAQRFRRHDPCRLHAYALMDNHLHLLMAGESDGAICRFLKQLLGHFTLILNRYLARTGPCWHGKYSFIPIQDEGHLLNSHLYIDANPWRAGLVEHPADSGWTSYGFNGRGRKEELLTPHEMLLQLGGPQEDWHLAYARLMDEYIRTAVRFKPSIRGPLCSDPLAGLHVFQTKVD